MTDTSAAVKTTTTRFRPKSFAWSYSKLKNYESCPKRSWHYDIARDVKEEESEALLYGNTVHKVLAEAISGKAPLPKTFAHLQGWVGKIAGGVTSVGNTQIRVEQQLAITEDFGPSEWFGATAWYRGIADVIKIVGQPGHQVAVVLDWKTGKILEDGVQLALMAACVFAHHPGIQKIRTEFVWLKEDATTRADFMRADMVRVWAGVMPRVQTLEAAHKDSNFPAKPGSLCRKWCGVTQCPHQGV